jgi:hypothetical protein
MNLSDEGLRLLAASRIAQRQGGHAHFWERALTRRQFLATTGLAGGAIVTSSIWMPLLAEASGSAGPTPIPYGPGVPGHPELDESSIFDFKGLVGVADIDGPGAGVHNGAPIAGATFGSDNRFMKGTYIDTGGKRRHGTFAFI